MSGLAGAVFRTIGPMWRIRIVSRHDSRRLALCLAARELCRHRRGVCVARGLGTIPLLAWGHADCLCHDTNEMTVSKHMQKHRGLGLYINTAGYVLVSAKWHPKSDRDGYIYEHILVAESVLGRYLPLKAVVHHVNEKKGDNRRRNLVICENNTYHKLLHQRLRAFHAIGQANARLCRFCKRYATDLTVDARNSAYHRACRAQSERKRRGYKPWQETGRGRRPLEIVLATVKM